ncbi:MAG: 1,4-dihydroxy-2-naphthoate polyprenyltransferase [Candidatus Binatia bacterium]|nr:1,4-dihydroxy-2-naphthoate polyprenyltransferase [Candidatus Binatia bacterium]
MSESRASLLLSAIRPRTLPASLVPVVVGSAVAGHGGAFDPAIAGLAILAAVLLQIGTNLINDYGDHVRGADGDDRIGPSRASQSGEVDPKQVALLGGTALLGAALVGVLLIAHGGWPIVWIGVGSLLAAVAYTAGPFPLAYHGLGEVFVFAFFGPVAVLGTQYLQAGEISAGGVAASVAIGALAAAILLVNNVRDVEGDTRAGKRTIVVRLGRRAGRALYVLALALGFGAPLVGWLAGWLPAGALVAWLSLPLGISPLRTVLTTTEGPPLNEALANTAKLELAFGIAFAVGMLL